ncbi:MAG: thiolase family protein [Planctomycetes bacterium]|nr:thiolase family protein [Planctomycetota bacterium]
MARIAIIDGIRTPMGMFGGAFRDLTAQRLGELVTRELMKRTKLDPARLDHVIFGCCGQASDAPNIARVIALQAGIPKEVPALTVMRNCASGIQALTCAAQNILTGEADAQIAGGTEVMSAYPFVSRDLRWGHKLQHSALIDTIWEGLTDPVANQIMGRTAENLVEEFGITREEQDKLAVESHRRAFRATREGKFKEETMAVEVPKKVMGKAVAPDVVSQDEGINAALSMNQLALYPTIFKENGTVTPGNSCPISDAACALLVMSEKKAQELGLEPLGFLTSWGYAGLAPERMGLGPCSATPLALARAKLEMKDVELFELNEAFAAQVLACRKCGGFPADLTNVNGGAIALGHPVGMTGARLALTLLRELKRRGQKRGLATLCVGGGQGAAILVERPA